MLLLFWIVLLITALTLLVKGAGWMLDSAEIIGKALRFSPFIIGVLLVGIGTSLPELVSSLYAVFAGATNIPVANAMGSNIANILLIIGASAIYAGKLKMKGNLMDIDFPLLIATTGIVVLMSLDGIISRPESIMLTLGVVLYLAYAMTTTDPSEEFADRGPGMTAANWLWFIAGTASLALGAKYAVDAVLAISEITAVGTGALALFAIAIGTSLPELVVSIQAAREGKAELIFGNIFGSNIFNILAVIGIPGLFSVQLLDMQTMTYGIPVLILATLFFLISALSQRINRWEGVFMLFVYCYFTGAIFGFL